MDNIDEQRKANDDMLWEKYHKSSDGRCEHCGSSSGTEVLICGYTNEECHPDDCPKCEVDACPLRVWKFKCSICGWYTEEE